MSLPQTSGSALESPWLWLALFLSGAIVALTLAAPRFHQRQPQLERQYQAREQSGYAVPGLQDPAETIEQGELIISLRPLQIALVVCLILCTTVFWIQRIRAYSRGTGATGPRGDDS